MASLQLPPSHETNDGLAHIAKQSFPEDRSIQVPMLTLDGELGSTQVDLLKIDVEGFESEVIRGASKALREGRITHIVFEYHFIETSQCVRLLKEKGYTVFSLGWSLRRPRIQHVEHGALAKRYEAPNFLATLSPKETLERFRPAGWLTFRDQTKRRSVAPSPETSWGSST